MLRFLIIFVFRFYYLPWSKLYQWVERKFTRHYAYKKEKTVFDLNRIKEHHQNPFDRYAAVWKAFPGIKWKKDKWYMLWDVISDPYMIFANGGNDCDNFALVSYHILGKKFNYFYKENGVQVSTYYEFQGIWSFLYPKWLGVIPGGHCMGIWKAKGGGEYIASSNMNLWHFNSKHELLNWYYTDNKPVRYIGKFTEKLELIDVEVIDGKN